MLTWRAATCALDVQLADPCSEVPHDVTAMPCSTLSIISRQQVKDPALALAGLHNKKRTATKTNSHHYAFLRAGFRCSYSDVCIRVSV